MFEHCVKLWQLLLLDAGSYRAPGRQGPEASTRFSFGFRHQHVVQNVTKPVLVARFRANATDIDTYQGRGFCKQGTLRGVSRYCADGRNIGFGVDSSVNSQAARQILHKMAERKITLR